MSSSSFLKALKRCVSACKKYNDDYPPLSADTGVLKALRESNGAGRFNSFYRGKDLGTTTAENLADISRRIANNFEDLYCGDTITGASTNRLYDFAAADYHYALGDTQLSDHHILVVPRNAFGNVTMNTSSTTEGAYVGSQMFKEHLNVVLDSVLEDFGENHVIEYRTYLQNATTNGKVSGNAWYSRKIDLMNEAMVYGCYVYSSAVSSDTKTGNAPFTDDNSQLPLFRYRKDLIITNMWYVLRDVCSSSEFAAADKTGSILGHIGAASNTHIRPYFLIK